MNSFWNSVVVASIAATVVTTIANTGTTVYLHRALSHRALTLRPSVAWFFRMTIWLTTGIKPKEWVAVHRKHHAYTDEEGDPHSPVLLGWWYVQKMNVALYRKALSDKSITGKYARDLPDDKWDKVLFGHNKTGLGIGIAILMIVLGPWTGLLAAFIHANVYLAGNAAVNALGHHFGKRPHPNNATNIQWLAFFTMGEGLHNNHHAAPSSPRLSHQRGQIDFGWWVIWSLQKLRLATLRFSDIRLAGQARRTVDVAKQ
ncbi:MAG: fatty acid desaturase [Ilumatobacteraceae bacterium]